MSNSPPLFHVVPGPMVKKILGERLGTIVELVHDTYVAHENGETANPDSCFLRFPKNPQNRIIALPAALTGTNSSSGVSGIKWIASYPNNIIDGIPRASAVLILNDAKTGFPYAVLEAATISAVRTAASAVLGAYWLNWRKDRKQAGRVAFVGGGVIARHILDMFAADAWNFDHISVCDNDADSATALLRHAASVCRSDTREVALQDALTADIVVFATTASEPYVVASETFKPGQIILNISLRDIGPDIIAESYNYFDDVAHCMKANTSAHLAEQKFGTRTFVTGTIAQQALKKNAPKTDKPIIFSPFGMGILDLAVGRLVYEAALDCGGAIQIPSFFAEEKRW